MATIFHLAVASEWEAAQRAGQYTISTRGRTLAQEGFIHASRADQWTGVRERFYADVAEPLVLLKIDTDRLDVPVVDEPAEPGSTQTFPHIYGPLPIGAVVRAIPLPPSGRRAPASPYVSAGSSGDVSAAPGTPAGTAQPATSFTTVYFREMFVNAALILLVIGCGFAGILIGQSTGSDAGPGIGGLVGLAIGATLAILVYRRRSRRPTA